MSPYRILRVVLLLLLGSLLVTRSVALEVVGSIGGSCPSVAAKDGYVYLCEGRGLTVLDARAAGDPVVIERVRLDAGTTCVRLDNDVAYVGTVDKKVRLYSLANPASSTLLSTITLIGGSLTDAAFEGGHAFFANEGGVEIVDVSDLAAPVGVSRYALAFTPSTGDPRTVCVLGTRMYVTSGIYNQEVDVSDPENPSFLADLEPPDGLPYSFHFSTPVIRKSGTELYVAWNIWSVIGPLPDTTGTVGVYRQEPGNLTKLIGWKELGWGQAISDLFRQDARVYIVNGSGLTGLDVTNPQEISLASRLTHPGFGYRHRQGATDGTGSLLTVVDHRELTKIEIGLVDAMSVGGHYSLFNEVRASAVSGGGRFAATGSSLALVCIDSPTTPTLLYSRDDNFPATSAIAINRCLYLSSENTGLDIRYVTIEPAIATVTTLSPLAGESVEDPIYGGLALAGDTVWLAYRAGGYGGWELGLLGFDASHPLRPAARGKIRWGSASRDYIPVPQVAVSGTHACLAADKLYFFDISDPSSPGLLSEVPVELDSSRRGLFWSDDLVLLLDTGSRLIMVDASDAANPVLLAPSSPIPGWCSLRWVENGRAYIGTYRVLDIYRVVPGGEPVLLESFASRGNISSVEMYGGHVYAMDSEDGLLVMKTNFPDHLAQRHLLGSDTGAADQNGDGAIDAADLVLAMAAARE
jgi:hypothetical protein